MLGARPLSGRRDRCAHRAGKVFMDCDFISIGMTALGRWKQEDQIFKTSLSYIGNVRPTWAQPEDLTK